MHLRTGSIVLKILKTIQASPLINILSPFKSSFLVLQGDAVFWYNLDKNGFPDERTKHAACPVVVGSKWGKYLQIRAIYLFCVASAATSLVRDELDENMLHDVLNGVRQASANGQGTVEFE